MRRLTRWSAVALYAVSVCVAVLQFESSWHSIETAACCNDPLTGSCVFYLPLPPGSNDTNATTDNAAAVTLPTTMMMPEPRWGHELMFAPSIPQREAVMTRMQNGVYVRSMASMLVFLFIFGLTFTRFYLDPRSQAVYEWALSALGLAECGHLAYTKWPSYGRITVFILFAHSFLPLDQHRATRVSLVISVPYVAISIATFKQWPPSPDGYSTHVQMAVAVLSLCLFIGIRILYSKILDRSMRQNFLDEQMLSDGRKRFLQERELSDKLLRAVLPDAIIERLRNKSGDLIADTIDGVTVLFAELCIPDHATAMVRSDSSHSTSTNICRGSEDGREGVTHGASAYHHAIATDSPRTAPAAADLSSAKIVSLLNLVYSSFDSLIDSYQSLRKIETVGTIYLLAAGVPAQASSAADTAADAARMALLMQRTFHEALPAIGRIVGIDTTGMTLRVGLHTGSVAAGIVGSVHLRYKLVGDTVNLASRMQSTCALGRVQVSSQCREALEQHMQAKSKAMRSSSSGGNVPSHGAIGTSGGALSPLPAPDFVIELRGDVEIKGKGVLTTYWLKSAEDSIETVDDTHETVGGSAVNTTPAWEAASEPAGVSVTKSNASPAAEKEQDSAFDFDSSSAAPSSPVAGSSNAARRVIEEEEIAMDAEGDINGDGTSGKRRAASAVTSSAILMTSVGSQTGENIGDSPAAVTEIPGFAASVPVQHQQAMMLGASYQQLLAVRMQAQRSRISSASSFDSTIMITDGSAGQSALPRPPLASSDAHVDHEPLAAIIVSGDGTVAPDTGSGDDGRASVAESDVTRGSSDVFSPSAVNIGRLRGGDSRATTDFEEQSTHGSSAAAAAATRSNGSSAVQWGGGQWAGTDRLSFSLLTAAHLLQSTGGRTSGAVEQRMSFILSPSMSTASATGDSRVSRSGIRNSTSLGGLSSHSRLRHAAAANAAGSSFRPRPPLRGLASSSASSAAASLSTATTLHDIHVSPMAGPSFPSVPSSSFRRPDSAAAAPATSRVPPLARDLSGSIRSLLGLSSPTPPAPFKRGQTDSAVLDYVARRHDRRRSSDISGGDVGLAAAIASAAGGQRTTAVNVNTSGYGFSSRSDGLGSPVIRHRLSSPPPVGAGNRRSLVMSPPAAAVASISEDARESVLGAEFDDLELFNFHRQGMRDGDADDEDDDYGMHDEERAPDGSGGFELLLALFGGELGAPSAASASVSDVRPSPYGQSMAVYGTAPASAGNPSEQLSSQSASQSTSSSRATGTSSPFVVHASGNSAAAEGTSSMQSVSWAGDAANTTSTAYRPSGHHQHQHRRCSTVESALSSSAAGSAAAPDGQPFPSDGARLRCPPTPSASSSSGSSSDSWNATSPNRPVSASGAAAAAASAAGFRVRHRLQARQASVDVEDEAIVSYYHQRIAMPPQHGGQLQQTQQHSGAAKVTSSSLPANAALANTVAVVANGPPVQVVKITGFVYWMVVLFRWAPPSLTGMSDQLYRWQGKYLTNALPKWQLLFRRMFLRGTMVFIAILGLIDAARFMGPPLLFRSWLHTAITKFAITIPLLLLCWRLSLTQWILRSYTRQAVLSSLAAMCVVLTVVDGAVEAKTPDFMFVAITMAQWLLNLSLIPLGVRAVVALFLYFVYGLASPYSYARLDLLDGDHSDPSMPPPSEMISLTLYMLLFAIGEFVPALLREVIMRQSFFRQYW